MLLHKSTSTHTHLHMAKAVAMPFMHSRSSHYDQPPVTCTIHHLIVCTSTINPLIMTIHLLHAQYILSL